MQYSRLLANISKGRLPNSKYIITQLFIIFDFVFFSSKFLNLHFYFVDKENTADCWFACFQENMNNLNEMLKRFEARQVQILLQIKVSSAFQSG